MLKELFFNFIKKNEILKPPYDYEFLMNLEEEKYPLYLKRIFELSTGKKLNLKNPKTFNEKIQWLKLYDSDPNMY